MRAALLCVPLAAACGGGAIHDEDPERLIEDLLEAVRPIGTEAWSEALARSSKGAPAPGHGDPFWIPYHTEVQRLLRPYLPAGLPALSLDQIQQSLNELLRATAAIELRPIRMEVLPPAEIRVAREATAGAPPDRVARVGLRWRSPMGDQEVRCWLQETPEGWRFNAWPRVNVPGDPPLCPQAAPAHPAERSLWIECRTAASGADAAPVHRLRVDGLPKDFEPCAESRSAAAFLAEQLEADLAARAAAPDRGSAPPGPLRIQASAQTPLEVLQPLIAYWEDARCDRPELILEVALDSTGRPGQLQIAARGSAGAVEEPAPLVEAGTPPEAWPEALRGTSPPHRVRLAWTPDSTVAAWAATAGALIQRGAREIHFASSPIPR